MNRKKVIVGLIIIGAIAVMAMFAGCIEKTAEETPSFDELETPVEELLPEKEKEAVAPKSEEKPPKKISRTKVKDINENLEYFNYKEITIIGEIEWNPEPPMPEGFYSEEMEIAGRAWVVSIWDGTDQMLIFFNDEPSLEKGDYVKITGIVKINSDIDRAYMCAEFWERMQEPESIEIEMGVVEIRDIKDHPEDFYTTKEVTRKVTLIGSIPDEIYIRRDYDEETWEKWIWLFQGETGKIAIKSRIEPPQPRSQVGNQVRNLVKITGTVVRGPSLKEPGIMVESWEYID